MFLMQYTYRQIFNLAEDEIIYLHNFLFEIMHWKYSLRYGNEILLISVLRKPNLLLYFVVFL